MPEADIFVGLAQIAGIFVGFAGLIGATREQDASAHAAMQMVVGAGLMVIGAALVPIALARYGFSAETVWRASSVVFFAIIWVGWTYGYFVRSKNPGISARISEASGATLALYFFLELSVELPLIVIMLGLRAELFAALYTTSIVAGLLQGALSLAQLVLQPPDAG